MNNAPWNTGLPTALVVGGEAKPIRTDYRVALDICLALCDPDLDEYNRAMEALDCLYLDEIAPEDYQEALQQCFWYLRGGEEERGQRQPQLVSWAQDFNMIASPISKIVGQDIRGMESMHWWTFLSAYMAIGDCLFAQVVRIRDMKARGKPLDKQDREFYRRNRDLIDIKKPLTEAENDILEKWIRG